MRAAITCAILASLHKTYVARPSPKYSQQIIYLVVSPGGGGGCSCSKMQLAAIIGGKRSWAIAFRPC